MQENPGRVVTKYRFSKLFAQAWYKAASPGNLIAGFRKAGIYPYNPEAIQLSPTNPSDEDQSLTTNMSDKNQPLTTNPSNENHPFTTDGDYAPQNERFTFEQIEHFERRFENGYDIYADDDYIAWLFDNHRDAISEGVLLQCPSGPLPITGSGDSFGDDQHNGKTGIENLSKDTCDEAKNGSGLRDNLLNCKAAANCHNNSPSDVHLRTLESKLPVQSTCTSSSISSSSRLSTNESSDSVSSSLSTPWKPLSVNFAVSDISQP